VIGIIPYRFVAVYLPNFPQVRKK